jgi:hypothetical protein
MSVQFLYNKLDALISHICFGNETLRVSDSSSAHHQELFTVHSAMVCVIQVCRQLSSSSRIRMELQLHPDLAPPLVGFIIKEFATMHGHMNVKFVSSVLFSYIAVFSSSLRSL